MPLVGDIHGSDSNGIDLANESGSDNGNEITLEQLLMNLANSGNEKHVKLALELLDLNLVQETIGLNGSDKVLANGNENIEKGISIDNTTETNMERTTVRPRNKRVRSNSNDSEKINLEITVSPNKKQKSARPNNNDVRTTGNGNRKQGQGQSDQKTRTKSEIRTRNALSKDSVLVAITEIPENTYFNSIKMENMILNSFPKLIETGMWTKYRVNKRHQCKCYVTLPKDHFNENVSELIQSQKGFDNSKVKVIKGINDVPEKAHKVVAIGVHQTISEDDIKTELAKNNVKINKVQRLKYNGQPTRKVVIQFENEQAMKIALYSGIYFGRIRIRC